MLSREEAQARFGPGFIPLIAQIYAVAEQAGASIVDIQRRGGALWVQTEALAVDAVEHLLVRVLEQRSAATCEGCGGLGERVTSGREARILCALHAYPWLEDPTRGWHRIVEGWKAEHDIEDDKRDGIDDREDWQR